MMGLFGFLKKSDVAPPKPFDINQLKTDLPSIEGLKLPDGGELPTLELPPIENIPAPQTQDFGALNTRVPGIRHAEEQNIFDNNNPQSRPEFSPDAFSLQEPMPEPEAHPNAHLADVSTDINQLFLSDPEWKEPDWKEFVPYDEPVIEPPAPQDFPEEEHVENKPSEPKDYALPVFEVLEQEHKPLPEGDLPYDVYVKGPDFKKIIDDINLIKTTLNYQDTHMSDVMEKFKNEAEMLSYNKELMEFLYKKMIYIEKKVFA